MSDKLIELSQEDRENLGQRLKKQYDAWQSHKAGLEPRWDRLEGMMRGEADSPGELPWEGAVFRNIPVLSSKAKAWLAYVSSSPTKAMPYLVGTIFGKDSTRANDVESDFYMLMRQANWQRAFRRNCHNIGLYGKAVWRVRVDDSGPRPKFEFKACRPRSMVAYPNTEEGVSAMVQIGHEYEIRYSELKMLQDKGEFYDVKVEPQTTKPAQPQTGKMNESQSIAVEDADRPVPCVEALCRLQLGDDPEEEWYRVRYVSTDGAVLAVYDYPYSRPWYIDMFVHEEQGRWWPESSRFNDGQDIQLAVNDQWNWMQWGAQMSAFPAQYAVGWALPQKYARTKPGQVVPILQGGAVTGVQSRYDPSVSPLLLQDLDKRMDLTFRIGTQQSGGQPNYDRTATGAQIREQAKDAAIEDDLAHMDVGMSEMGEFMQELYAYHHDQFKAAYGDAMMVQDPSILSKPIQWEMMGKTPMSTPQAQAQSAIALAQMLSQFTPELMMILEAAKVNAGEFVRTLVSNSMVESRKALLIPDQAENYDSQGSNYAGIAQLMASRPGMGALAAPGGVGPGGVGEDGFEPEPGY